MKYLKIYEDYKYDDKFGEIRRLCEKYGIRDFKINHDESIDVNGYVSISGQKREKKKKLRKIPIKFNRVDGTFTCSFNNLTTLKNCPINIKESFTCTCNKLTTLLDGPKYVGMGYYCNSNNLKDLYGFPESHKGMVDIYNNPVNEIIELIQNYYEPEIKLGRMSFSGFDITNKFIYLLNDEKVIRNGNTIIQDRLEEALFGIGIHKLNKTEFENYKLV